MVVLQHTIKGDKFGTILVKAKVTILHQGTFLRYGGRPDLFSAQLRGWHCAYVMEADNDVT